MYSSASAFFFCFLVAAAAAPLNCLTFFFLSVGECVRRQAFLFFFVVGSFTKLLSQCLVYYLGVAKFSLYQRLYGSIFSSFCRLSFFTYAFDPNK